MNFILVFIIGYLLGNISIGAYIVKKFDKKDVRSIGSGSSGGTNVFRASGPRAALLTVAIDISKGALPTLLALMIFGREYAIIAGLGAILGHNWPVFNGFKGGKGVATSAGALLVLHPLLLLAALVYVAVIIAATKYMSVATLSVTLLIWAIIFFTNLGNPWEMAMITIYGALIFYQHRANISRLLSGKENKLDFKRRNK